MRLSLLLKNIPTVLSAAAIVLFDHSQTLASQVHTDEKGARLLARLSSLPTSTPAFLYLQPRPQPLPRGGEPCSELSHHLVSWPSPASACELQYIENALLAKSSPLAALLLQTTTTTTTATTITEIWFHSARTRTHTLSSTHTLSFPLPSQHRFARVVYLPSYQRAPYDCPARKPIHLGSGPFISFRRKKDKEARKPCSDL